jgi:hypothetical protein
LGASLTGISCLVWASVHPCADEIEEGIIMMLISSGVSTRPVDQHAELSSRHRFGWTPRWVQRRREAKELARWASAVVWQWNDTMGNIDLAHHTVSAARVPVLVAPQVQSIDPGPPVTLLICMLPGQIPEDFQAHTHRIAAGMDVPVVRITPWSHGVIKVTLLDHESLPAALPVPA